MSGLVGGAGAKSGVIGTTELDYEEGTWTATLSSGACTGTLYYVKIGKSVTVYGKIAHSSNGSDSAGVTINNPPFAIKHTTGFYGSASLNTTSLLDSGDTQAWFLMDTGNTMVLHGHPGNSGANSSRWAAGMTVAFHCNYITS